MAADELGDLGTGLHATGTVASVKGNFGFIKQDSGEPDMFMLPPFPPIGSRVSFEIATDAKTGRPRADNVEVIDSVPQQQFFPAAPRAAVHHASSTFKGLQKRQSGTIMSMKGNFGFIVQDSGEPDMFVLPPVPPIGTRVTYEVVLDEKTGRPRAQEVRPEEWDRPQWPAPPQTRVYPNFQAYSPLPKGKAVGKGNPSYGSRLSGSVSSIKGNFGFIAQDNGEPDMFVLPPFPAVGTRVTYDMVLDAKTGRPRAENVEEEHGFGAKAGHGHSPGRSQPYARPTPASPNSGGTETGTVAKSSGSFGFIEQDSGGPQMFMIPQACPGFGKELPPEGARVQYHVVTDQKTGRARAEDVVPALA
jgi:cold shock CspA family protein